MSALAQAAPERPLRVLLVHGMGTPTPNGFDPFIASIAGRFGLVQVPPADAQPQWQGCHQDTPAQPTLIQPKPTPIENAAADQKNWAQLYTYDFAPSPNAKPTLTVNYLLWTPLTEQIKCNLAVEDNGAPAKQALAAFAKNFIDDKLADAVLYGGAYREKVIRPSVQGALCKVTGGTWHADSRTCAPGDYQDPTVIITHSLGGYMLMDAIQAELRTEDCRPDLPTPRVRSPAEKILENTPVIYMMANQLALLDLSTLHRNPQAAKTMAEKSASEAVTKQFASCWVAARARSKIEAPIEPGEIAPPKSQVVAFTDPNDILSWRLEPKNLRLPRPDWGEVAVTNVYLSNNEFSVPSLFSDPVNAHTGYFANPTVMDMLICGMNNGSVPPCAVIASAH